MLPRLVLGLYREALRRDCQQAWRLREALADNPQLSVSEMLELVRWEDNVNRISIAYFERFNREVQRLQNQFRGRAICLNCGREHCGGSGSMVGLEVDNSVLEGIF